MFGMTTIFLPTIPEEPLNNVIPYSLRNTENLARLSAFSRLTEQGNRTINVIPAFAGVTDLDIEWGCLGLFSGFCKIDP